MRAHNVDVRESTGKILYSTIFYANGKKLLARGHRINEEDVGQLSTAGLNQVCIAEIETNEISETQATMEIAMEMACGAVQIEPSPGGRATVCATETSCILVDQQLLGEINCTSSIVVATVRNFSHAHPGQRVAMVKSRPFAVAKAELQTLVSMLQRRGPLLQGRAISKPALGVLYTDSESGSKARRLFEHVLERRLSSIGVNASYALTCGEDDESLAKSLHQLLLVKPTVVLIASATAPAGPDDAIGRAMLRVGCQIERFLAPVEPGTLLLLAHRDNVPILSAPGCFHSFKPNVLDLILPPLLAGYRLPGCEVGSLGHGGLLS